MSVRWPLRALAVLLAAGVALSCSESSDTTLGPEDPLASAIHGGIPAPLFGLESDHNGWIFGILGWEDDDPWDLVSFTFLVDGQAVLLHGGHELEIKPYEVGYVLRHKTWLDGVYEPGVYEVCVEVMAKNFSGPGERAVTYHNAACLEVTVAGELGAGFGPEQFALIPAGTFQMGDHTGNGVITELPVHTVNITKAFHLQKTEVTQGQWRAVMGENPSYFTACGDLCPVEQVSWEDIQLFLKALNDMDPGQNYRLPTEAEWEYAARAGTTGDYGGTGVLDDMGWYYDNSGDLTHPVALKQPNHWGLYDMHGNVLEWVQDWWGPYTAEPQTDPTGPDTGSTRVLRGGSWIFIATDARSASRTGGYPSDRGINDGFRLARTL